MDRTTPIREVKRALKIEYKKLGNKSKNIDKEIVFYCDGKPITDEDEQIGNIADDGEINLAMLSVSLNDSSMKDNYKIQEKLINKLASNCKFHSGNKELLICVTCGMAICDQCGNNHEGHEKLYKTELINSGRELNRKSQEINNIFMECGFSDTKGNNNLCKEEKQRINMNIDNMQKMVDEIKKTSRNLNNSFNKTYDDLYPYIMDYKEKIKKLNEKSQHLKTIKNEQDFIDYYYSYSELKRKEKKILEYLTKIRTQVESYKEILKDFYNGTNRIIENSREEYNTLINLQFYEDMEALGKSSFYRKTIDRTLGSVTTKHIGGGGGKINLINMLVPKEKSRLLDNEKKQYINKQKIKRLNESSKLNDENMRNDDANLNLVFGMEINTRNLFIFDKTTNQITKMNLNFNGLPIDKFLNSFATLNYMGRFYISGGIQNPKNFFRLDTGNKTFKQLKNMPTGHNFHGMIGIGNNIFVVTGFKNPNVEKYDLSTNSWTNLQPLENSISWPQCISIEDRFLYVFGDSCERGNVSNKKIYRMDIMNPSGNWEILDVSSSLKKLPFYSGLVQLGPKKALVLGGKFSSIEGNSNKCFDFNFDNNSYNPNGEYHLPNGEVFNGKRFCDLGNGLFGEFSSYSRNKFYLVNTSSKSINIIQ